MLVIIRKYKAVDREAVRKICCDTAFMGEPAENFFDDRKIFADVAISYYTDYEPESLFVAERENNIVGYLAGCKDTQRFKKIFACRIVPRAFLSSVFRGTLFKKNNLRFVFSLIKSFFKGESHRPDCSKGFPAHLHINMGDSFRNSGTGTQLVEKFLEYLRDNNIQGVHLYSFSPAGQQFFQKLQFDTVFSQSISYFEYLGKYGIKVSCFAKRLS